MIGFYLDKCAIASNSIHLFGILPKYIAISILVHLPATLTHMLLFSPQYVFLGNLYLLDHAYIRTKRHQLWKYAFAGC